MCPYSLVSLYLWLLFYDVQRLVCVIFWLFLEMRWDEMRWEGGRLSGPSDDFRDADAAYRRRQIIDWANESRQPGACYLIFY